MAYWKTSTNNQKRKEPPLSIRLLKCTTSRTPTACLPGDRSESPDNQRALFKSDRRGIRVRQTGHFRFHAQFVRRGNLNTPRRNLREKSSSSSSGSETPTSICMVNVHNTAMNIVPNMPTTYPALLNALGMANIPVLRLAFNKCIRVSQYLEKSRGVTRA